MWIINLSKADGFGLREHAASCLAARGCLPACLMPAAASEIALNCPLAAAIISYHVEAKSDKGDVATGFVTTNGQDTNGVSDPLWGKRAGAKMQECRINDLSLHRCLLQASITMSWTLYRNVLCNKIQKRWFYTTYAVSALGSSVKATNPAWFWDNDGIC